MAPSGRWWNISSLAIALLLLLLWTSRLFRDARAHVEARRLREDRLARIEHLERQREAARLYVQQLSADPDTIERLIRGMGYVRPQETVYVLRDAVPPAAATGSGPARTGPRP
jgi:hypothetical protein